VAVGTIVWLASELMFFAALFAAYFTIRNVTNAQAESSGLERRCSVLLLALRRRRLDRALRCHLPAQIEQAGSDKQLADGASKPAPTIEYLLMHTPRGTLRAIPV
jgi:hypothetical protein